MNPGGLAMSGRRRAAVAGLCAVALWVGLPATGQSRRGDDAAGRAAEAAALVEEFKGAAEPKQRPAQQLLEAWEKALAYLLERAGSVRLSSRYRLAAMEDLEAICLRAARPGAELERSIVCGLLARALEDGSSAAPRGEIIDLLGRIGGEESVAALAGLVETKDPRLRERARRALEGNGSAKASEALRAALLKAVEPGWRVALINALGGRRDAGSVAYLAKLLKDPEKSVALAAAAALGRVGTAEARAALADRRPLATGALRGEIADALFACAEKALADGDRAAALAIWRKTFENPLEPMRSRVAALRCLVAAEGQKATPLILSLLTSGDAAIQPVALALAREVPGREATRAFAALLERAESAERKVALLDLLGARGDPTARESVLAAIRGRKWAPQQQESVEAAVVRALGGVGSPEDVALLARLATQEDKARQEVRKWARWALRRLHGRGVDEALLDLLAAAEPAVRREAIAALAERGASQAAPALVKVLAEKDPLMRQAALDALGRIGGPDAVAPLAEALNAAGDSSEVYRIERALVEICSRCDRTDEIAATLDAAVAAANPRARAAVIRICGRMGGGKALEVVSAAARSGDADVRRHALQALGYFRDLRAADELIKIAASASKPETRTEAIRSYLRLAGYLEQAPEKRLWMYLRVLDVAVRDEEKKLALARLGDVRTLASMKLAMEHLDFPALRPAAEQAACRVARYIYEAHPEEVHAAMQRLIRTSENTETYKEARQILSLAEEVLKKRAAEKKP